MELHVSPETKLAVSRTMQNQVHTGLGHYFQGSDVNVSRFFFLIFDFCMYIYILYTGL